MFSWFGTRKVLEDKSLKAEKIAAHPSHKMVLDHLEAVLIAVAEPRLNRQGGKWGEGVDQYLQIRDVRLGCEMEALVKEMHADMKTFINQKLPRKTASA